MRHTHYGDEDPEFKENTDPEYERELFETARFMSYKPEDLRDREFAAKYSEWLNTALSEE